MSLLIGLVISLVICFLAIWLLPQPKYGQMRGCTGRALQAALERKAETGQAGKNEDTPPQ